MEFNIYKHEMMQEEEDAYITYTIDPYCTNTAYEQ